MKCILLVVLAVGTFLISCHAGAARAESAARPAVGDSITYAKHVAPILFQHCVECHRPGEVAPFSLLSFADAKKRATMIATVTSERIMPPWKSVAGHGSFVGERRLTSEEIEVIARWIDQGMPEGDAQDLPAPPQFTEGWKLGPPDIALTMDEAYEIPAEGRDIYRNFVFELDIPPGKYLKAVDFRPLNRQIVHHAQLCMDVSEESRKADEADSAAGFPGVGNPPGQLLAGSMATWTPGHDPVPLPEGMSMPWKAGADFVLQLHLHLIGKPEAEQSSLGFYLTDEPPQRSMLDMVLIDMDIDIPPGEQAYCTRAVQVMPVDVEVVGVFPHMHLIGHDFKLTAHPPEGDPISLLWIDDWDFNWQTYYQYVTPVKLTAGTRVVMEAVHDNSADNIHNPN